MNNNLFNTSPIPRILNGGGYPIINNNHGGDSLWLN